MEKLERTAVRALVYFDYKAVSDVFQAMGWTGANGLIPDEDVIKETAQKLMEDVIKAYDGNYSAMETMRLRATIMSIDNDTVVSLEFVPISKEAYESYTPE